MERILRTICCGDSSKARNKQVLPLLQAAFAKEAAILVLPVPAVPDTRMLPPLKKPFPSSMASSAGMPEEIRSEDTGLLRSKEVMGSTVIPSASIKKGYSLV